MIRNGYGAPVVRVFNFTGTEVFERVTSFTYMHSEKVDDSTRIVIETNDIDLVDHPDLQEGKALKVVFGYLGGAYLRSHLVWIWDLSPTFNDQGLRLEIIGYCKAAYLKLNSSKDVYNGTNLEDVAGDIADKYGLNLEKENLDASQKTSNIEPIQFGNPKNSVFNLGRKDAFGNTTNTFYTNALDGAAYPIKTYVFKDYVTLPQGNKSDAKLLDHMVNLEPIDNLVLDGRDDNLIIKRRNLLQKPYKTYTYKAEAGHLLEFTPAVRNSEKRKKSVSNSVSGWNEEDQTFYQGSTNIGLSQQGLGLMGDMVDINQEDLLAYNQGTNTQSVDGIPTTEFEEINIEGNQAFKKVEKDSLGTSVNPWFTVLKKGVREKPGVFDFKQPIHLAAVDNVAVPKDYIVVAPKENINTVEPTKKDTGGVGVNRLSQQIAEVNECSATILGDPELQSGKVISLLGVGVKYSGNYYIIAAEHDITPQNGYVTRLTIFRNAKNKVIAKDPNAIDGEQIGLPKNKQIGLPFDGSSELFEVPVKKD